MKALMLKRGGEFVVDVVIFNAKFGDAIHFSINIAMKKYEFLIDVGRKGTYSRIADELQKEGKNIDYIILTHEHSDHVGALRYFLDDQRFNIRAVILNLEWGAYPGPSNSVNIKELHSKIIKKKIGVFTPQSFLQVNPSFSEKIILLNPTNIRQYYDNPNRNSIVIAIKNEDYFLLFMGDATKNEEVIMQQRKDIDYKKVRFIKIGHHGSETSTSDLFLQGLDSDRIDLAAVSCKSTRNSPPPHPGTIGKLEAKFGPEKICYTGDCCGERDIRISASSSVTWKEIKL